MMISIQELRRREREEEDARLRAEEAARAQSDVHLGMEMPDAMLLPDARQGVLKFARFIKH